MKVRDNLREQMTRKNDPAEKADITQLYKRYRMIVNLQRVSKKNYYTFFFQENQGNVKKTWDGTVAN